MFQSLVYTVREVYNVKHYCRNRKRNKMIRDLIHVTLGSITMSVIVIGVAQVAGQARSPETKFASPSYTIPPRVIQSSEPTEETTSFELVTFEPAVINGYTTTTVNIRSEPSTSSHILDTLKPFTIVEYTYFNDEWVKIEFQDQTGYLYSSYITEGDLPEYFSYYLTSKGFKSFMGYKAITATSSLQYKIQHEHAYTGEYGIRQVDGRFCVALGSAVDAKMGTYVDLVLENGAILNCILADQKADIHTMEDNLTTEANGCVSEFIVDTTKLESLAAKMGDVSYVDDSWKSPVVEIRVYPINIFD